MLHVLLFKDTENPNNIPGDWPAEVVHQEGPPAPPRIAMTEEEYNAYRAERQAEYDAWETAFMESQAQVEREKAAKQAEIQQALDADAFSKLSTAAKLERIRVALLESTK